MTADRREFPIDVQLAIVKRATDSSGRVHCEGCGIWLTRRKDYEIDHVISEGMRPSADKRRKLKPADGQLLCVAVCHPKKTKSDGEARAEAKRREAAELGLERPGKGTFRRPEKEKRPLRVAHGQPALLRRGFIPAGKP